MLVTVPVFSGHADAGKNDIGHHRRLGKKDVLHHKMLELGDAGAGMVEIGIGHGRVFALDVHALDLSRIRRVDNLYDGKAVFSESGVFHNSSNFVCTAPLVTSA